MAEAARALGVPHTTFVHWGKGYVRRSSSRRPAAGDPIVTVLPGRVRHPAVPFIGLAEGMILAAIRHAGVDAAVEVVRRHRAIALGMPQVRRVPVDLRPARRG